MRRLLLAVLAMCSLLTIGQTEAQARVKRHCPTRALALKTDRLVVFKVRVKHLDAWVEYVSCWRSTGVHHAVTGRLCRRI
ncbi:hypothetical protein FSW04_24605 [Baekduia soli]|uniref:Uncharacterized protein n=1 Tax=Baekduia soli TaxID=496014 RepID=A0A5B8UBN1_9ACTN|nr:hypothetical protein [Baekduia soli]QEC50450.1 hypothetical protein FSW04_24605 [Baekduia soli]